MRSKSFISRIILCFLGAINCYAFNPLYNSQGVGIKPKPFLYYGTLVEAHCNLIMIDSTKVVFKRSGESNLNQVLSYVDEKKALSQAITSLMSIKKDLMLNDWGYFVLVDEFVNARNVSDNLATFLTAYILDRSGYNVRLTKSADNRLLLFYSSDEVVYNKPYIKDNNQRFYLFERGQAKSNINAINLNLLKLNFTGKKTVSFALTNVPKLAVKMSEGRVFSYKGLPGWDFNIKVNKNLMDFYNEYPMSGGETNFMTKFTKMAEAPLSDEVKEQLYPTLKKLMAGKDQLTNINALLLWIQMGFAYQHDETVWGYDRAFFPDETLYYPYCDTEDRSTLFARLVNDLLGLKTIYLYSEIGHVAIGVQFTDQEVEGESYIYNGEKYVICDPTYYNAPAGKVLAKWVTTKAFPIKYSEPLFAQNTTNYNEKTTREDNNYLNSLPKNMRNLVEKQIKTVVKDGWKVKSGKPSMVKQLTDYYLKISELNSDGYEKWITGESISAGVSYDACKALAMTCAKEEISRKIQNDLAAQLYQELADKQITDNEIESHINHIITNNGKDLDVIISQSLPLIDMYRNTTNGNVEVMIRLAVSTDNLLTLTKNNQQQLASFISERIKKTSAESKQVPIVQKPKTESKTLGGTKTQATTIIKENKETFAVIIGNENYTNVTPVPYANNDAKSFADFCRNVLNLPKDNIRLYEDATYGTMISAMRDIKRIAKVYKGKLNVIFYYAGHGIPDEETKDAFLLPIDANGMDTEVCYPLTQLYQELDGLKANSVTAFLDACFSGSERGNGMIVAARGYALKVNNDVPKGNTVVFTAATGKQTAYPYKEKEHPYDCGHNKTNIVE